MNTFAARLKHYRTLARLSQSELARRAGAGITIDSVQNWETGRREPRSGAILPLAIALGIDVILLLETGKKSSRKSAKPG